MGAGSGIERRLLDTPRAWFGAIAQLGERVLCKHEVVGSIPSGSTIFVGTGNSALWSRPPAYIRV